MRLLAKGNTAEILEQDEKLVCKLFNSGYPKIYIEHEFDNAKKVYQLGIKTAMAHKLICVGDRNGILYDRVIGETLSHKMNNADEEKWTTWVEGFVEMHKELLSHSIDSVMDYKAMGIKTVWIDRNGIGGDFGQDYTIADLSGLIKDVLV